MRKIQLHFEQIPIEVAEKILEEQNLSAKPEDDRKLVIRKWVRTASGRHTRSKKLEVSTL